MIIVVEGPSAAGKTTWASRFASEQVVRENRPVNAPPDDPVAAAGLWADLGAQRWAQAARIERAAGIAVCDTDPLKLHYAWSLWRIGECDESELRAQIAAYRQAVTDGRIGFADRYAVEIPDAITLGRRRAADAVRRRRNFDLHSRLGEPLREWYSAIEKLRPGSVTWSYPEMTDMQPSPTSRDRHSLEDFDALMETLMGFGRFGRSSA